MIVPCFLLLLLLCNTLTHFVIRANSEGTIGQALVAEQINAHLPPEVRVFGAYSTPKGFEARKECINRTYEYLLPARVLGIGAEGGAAVPW